MAVRSLLAQTWRNIEVLIVDDCSKDGTWAVMQKLSADDSRIRIFRNEANAWPYVSKNIAASHARGVWITGHDADDWAHHERIERQVRSCERLQVPASLSGMVRMAANGSFVKLNKIGGFVYDGACRTAFISLMIRNQYFKDILGSWDTVRTGADSEMLHRIEKLQKQPVHSLPEVTMLCYDNPEGLTNHATFGFKEVGKVPPHRSEYKKKFTAAHIDVTKTNSRLPFPQKSRPFKAPEEMLNEPLAEQKVVRAYESAGVFLTKDIDADFAIIADLSIYGKNATSTISIIEKLRSTGATVTLIHCPADKSLGENISDLYSSWTHLIVNWTEVRKANVKTAICYDFEVLSSSSFGNLNRDLSSEQLFAVRNSPSDHEPSPSSADFSQAIDATRKVKTSALCFSATTVTLLQELREYRRKSNNRLEITDKPWNLVSLVAYEQQSS